MPVPREHFTHTIGISGFVTHWAKIFRSACVEDVLRVESALDIDTVDDTATVFEHTMLFHVLWVRFDAERVTVFVSGSVPPVVEFKSLVEQCAVSMPLGIEESESKLFGINRIFGVMFYPVSLRPVPSPSNRLAVLVGIGSMVTQREHALASTGTEDGAPIPAATPHIS